MGKQKREKEDDPMKRLKSHSESGNRLLERFMQLRSYLRLEKAGNDWLFRRWNVK